jgi:peptide/nickel transport system substrate-binding protein
MKLHLSLVTALCCGLFACEASDRPPLRSVETSGDTPAEIRIALRAEPSGLNPILTTQSTSRYVSEQVFQTLNDTDPESFELLPLLASVPEPEELAGGGVAYHYELDSLATWPNGSPVTVDDVIFSLKILLHPLIDAGPYRAYFSVVEDIATEKGSARKFAVLTREPYMLATKVIGDLYVYPTYAYDPDGLLSDIPLRTFTNPAAIQAQVKGNRKLKKFVDVFADPDKAYAPGQVVGSGPYELASWEEGQRIRLRKRPDYWAEDSQNPQTVAIAESLAFLIIPDQATLVNALRDNAVDIAMDLPSEVYLQLSDDDYLTGLYEFNAIPSFRYFAILLNQDDALLTDQRVRRALAHCVDVDRIIEQLLPGLARRVVGPVLPDKDYYDKELPFIPYDPDRAANLLTAAGWEDTDGDGIRDKVIDGVRRPLQFPLLSYPTSTSTAVCLIVAEGAGQVGIDIEVVRREPRSLFDQLSSGDYTASFYGQGYDPTPDDFSQVWASTAIPPLGTNRSNFNQPEADTLIRLIAQTMDSAARLPLYRRFQKIVYDDQPMIFLYSPYDRVVVSKRLDYQLFSVAPNLEFNALTLRSAGDEPLIN